MHELSIVEALIDEVAAEVQRAGRRGRVTRLDLTIGRLSGVHVDALRFAFQFLAPGTIVDGAELAVRERRARATCGDCGGAFETDDFLPACLHCRGSNVRIEGGREMVLDSIELEED